MIRKILTIVCSIAFIGNAIGYQHAIFRSQSTQGKTWTGTATITNEHFDITVHRDYLDVELEWVFNVGGQAPSEYLDALEIVGNVNLAQGSKVIGMLLWYKGELLKAKLKRKEVAREQYEEVVDRNAEIPPPPRDPVIFEYGWGEDNYYISIFPVKWDGSRRLRLRYVIPRANNGKSENFGYPHAFSNGATVNIKKGDDISGFKLLDYSGMTLNSCKDSISLGDDKEILTYGGKYWYIKPELQSTDPYNTHINFSSYTVGDIQGELACINNFKVGSLLKSIKDSLPVGNDKKLGVPFDVYAIVSNGAEKCSTGVHLNNINNIDFLTDSLTWVQDMFIFSRKPLIKEVVWHLYLNGKLWMESVEKPICEGLVGGTAVGCIAASTGLMSLDSKLPRSLGAAFGFVDTVFSLLALEDDKMPVYLKNSFEESGVPFLNKEDIFADTTDIAPSIMTALFQKNEFNIPLKVVMHSKTEVDLLSDISMFINNGTLTLSFGEMTRPYNGVVEVTVFSLSGKIIARELLTASLTHGDFRIFLNSIPPQTVIVNVKIGKSKIARVIHASKI
jgi:hypothetical protein